MGVKQLSRKLRPSDKRPDCMATSPKLKSKRIGVDLSVILHVALGSEEGAGQYVVKPRVTNQEVVDKCTRICGYAKANEIELIVSVDGKYHPMKEAENRKRNEQRDVAITELEKLFRDPEIAKKQKHALKLMKKAARVDEYITATAVQVFRDKGFKVYGAPYESDFQLVHWELTGFMHGTYTIDSDLYVMGCNMVIDLLNFGSAQGACKILIREQVQGKIMPGSELWSIRDTILYSALCGCDFIPRLFRLESTRIDELMARWKDPSDHSSLESLLTELSRGRHWPTGKNKPGAKATNFVEKVKICMGLMMHAPVIDCSDGQECKLIPLRPLDPGACWSDVIGFDPIENFSDVSVADSFNMRVWARTGIALPTSDANDGATGLPIGAEIKFSYTPPCIVPASLLRLWLFYHGVPHPKGSSKSDLVNQVQHALDLKQPLDDDRIITADESGAKSYVSFDTITVLSEVEWITDGNEILNVLRSTTIPKITQAYIDEIFGEKKNGVRNRAWLRFESGHLNVETLKMASTRIKIKGEEEVVTILEMKVTPSMKNVVYNVHTIFDTKGEYVPKQSRCDCPNGFLFCSHTLACFLLYYLVQSKNTWNFQDVLDFMPVPIKSLQNMPFAASYIFGELKISKSGSKHGRKKQDDDINRRIAKRLAKDLPGYSGKPIVTDEDAEDEGKILKEALDKRVIDEKSINLCKKVDDKFSGCEESHATTAKSNRTKVTNEDLETYNERLVANTYDSRERLRKLYRHERMYRMMKDNKLSRDSTMWSYLDHFANDRLREIERLGVEVESLEDGKELAGPKSPSYDSEYLREYFEQEE